MNIAETTFTETFFENYADALISYSPEKIASFYSTPLTVYSDRGVQTVTEMAEVVAFWKEGVKQYSAQKIMNTAHNIISEEQLSETVWTCKVRWDNSDSSGKVVASETNFYILSHRHDEVKIVGLIIITK